MGQSKLRRAKLGCVYGSPPTWAWHYTLGRKIPLILRDGFLRDEFTKSIPYTIWLTTAETVDPTSVPAMTLEHAYGFDREAFKRIAGGAWRIGFHLPHPELSTYEQALSLHSPATPFGGWCRSLPNFGENRKNWRIAWIPLSLFGCRIEEELQEGQWVPYAFDSLPRDEHGPGYGTPGVVVKLAPDIIDNIFCDNEDDISRIVAC
jgi:hypothetical protein